MANKPVYLNGRYLPIEDALISPLDRGFLFGDGVYEVIPAYLGRLFEFEAHMARLDKSLAAIHMDNPYSRHEWHDIFGTLLEDGMDQYIYVQITRGATAKRDPLFPESVSPTVFAMSSPLPVYPARNTGVKTVCHEDTRWQNCYIKAITLLPNVLLRQEAFESGGAEAILIKNGFVTEGTSSNVFAVIDGILMTPPLTPGILAGITRYVILKIAESNHIPCHELPISIEDLQKADEIWIASSIREIMPVIELDDQMVSDGLPGPIWNRMNRLFQAYKESFS